MPRAVDCTCDTVSSGMLILSGGIICRRMSKLLCFSDMFIPIYRTVTSPGYLIKGCLQCKVGVIKCLAWPNAVFAAAIVDVADVSATFRQVVFPAEIHQRLLIV